MDDEAHPLARFCKMQVGGIELRDSDKLSPIMDDERSAAQADQALAAQIL